mgnify:CR=1 FL=1
MPLILSASSSQVKIDGKTIEGLQSIEYRVIRERRDIDAIGSSERIGVDYGATRVEGRITVISVCPELDEKLSKPIEEASFQIVAELKRGQAIRTVTFDECYLENKEVSLEANGVLVTTYTFTATRVREE